MLFFVDVYIKVSEIFDYGYFICEYLNWLVDGDIIWVLVIDGVFVLII